MKTMKRTHMFSLLGVLCVLCFSLLARGQTPITISGDVTVCKGDTATYTVVPSAGLSYSWSTTYQGNVSSIGTGSATVSWVGTGSGTVYTYGIDGSGDTQEIGSLTVAIVPLPVPYITSNAQVGCQQLAGDSSKEGRPENPEILDDGHGCIRVCEYSTVTYYGHDQPGTTYTWDVSGEISFTDMGDSCIVNWGPNGPGSVTVTATNANGCVATKTICINIIPRPQAIFYTKPDSTYNTNSTGNLLTVCLGDNIVFRDISIGTSGSPIMAGYWDFGDGTVLPTSGPPSTVNHSYSTPGTYQVMLVVTNACNCKDTAFLRVEVLPSPGVKITCPGVVCEGDTAGYKVHIPCGTYAWSAEGGTILSPMAYTDSIEIKWDNVDTTGFGYVIFDGAPCGGVCPGKTIIKVPVIQQNGHISGPLIVCPNKQYIYRMPQWPTTDFVWTVTSGPGTLLQTDQRNEIVLTTTGTGTIVLKCNYTNTMLGCGGSATIIIQVQPAVSIIGPDKMCHKSTGNWTLSSGVATWTLTLPGGGTHVVPSSSSFSYTFNTLGAYSLAVSGAFCAPDPIGFTVTPLPPPPDSLLGPNVACAGIPTLYRGKHPIPGTTFKWAAYTGAVNSGTGSQTYATFSGTGPWVVSVKRQETGGAHCLSDSIMMTVVSPVPSFSISGPDTVCASTDHNYSVSYLDGDTYEWSIASTLRGSVTSLNDSPTVNVLWNNVTSPGQTAWLIVKIRKCNTYYYDSMLVYVASSPVLTVTATPDTICSGDLVTFNVSSIPSISSWTSISWDYGNGVTAAGASPTSQTYSYVTTGATTNLSFQATVTIVDANGCATTTGLSNPVIVKPAPVAHVSPDGPLTFCPPTPFSVTLVATVTSGVGTTTNYAWAPSGPSGPGANSWTVSSYGSYSCTVTNSNGCSATSNTVVIDSNCGPVCGPGTPPVLTVTPTLTACGHVYISASFTGAGFSPSWTYWPPNAIGVVTTPTDLDADFDVAGNYQFTYTVLYIDAAGNTCRKDTTVSIIVPYISGLKHAITCVAGSGYTVNLLDNSNFYPGVTLTYEYYLNWSMLTNNPGNMSATASGLGAGTYTLSEVIYDGTNPPCTTSYTITLDTIPNALFTVPSSPVCEDWVDIQFTNLSTPTSSTPPLTVLWNFGDGSTNSQWNPSRTYASAGTYPVSLTISNAYGCSSMFLDTVVVVGDSMNGVLASVPLVPCQGDPVTVQYQSSTSMYPTSYTWYEQSNVMYTNVPNSFITVFDPGGYWVHGFDAFGCIVNTPIHVVDIVQGPPAIITGDSSQCVDGMFTLNGWAGDDVLNYVWIVDGVPMPMGNTPTLDQTFATAGVHTYQLVVLMPKPGGGFCTDTSDVFTVVINALPPPPMPTFNILNCATYQVQLSATNWVPGTYTWSNGLSGTPVYTYSGGPYKVWFTDVNGCKSSTNMFVPKDPRTFLWVFPAGCYTFCKDDLPFTLLGPNNLTWWQPWEWWHNGGIASSGWGPVSPLTVTSPGTYSLFLDNGFCSAMSDSMDLAVIADCDDPCDKITMMIEGVYNSDGTVAMAPDAKDGRAAAAPAPGPCDKFVVMSFTNTFGSTVGGNITATNGTLTPGWTSIPPGTSSATFTFTPNIGFTSGWVVITMTLYLGNDDVKCVYTDSFYFKCPVKGGPGSLVVTEISNGPERNRDCEYAEMVVINCNSSDDKFVDVRGWIMDDNSGNFNTTGCDATVGITDGHYRLSYESIWSAVPVGSVIVIYNMDNNCYRLPRDFTVQNNGTTNTYWIPIGGTPSAPYGTPHVERFGYLPVAPTDCHYCYGDYEVANSWVKTIGFYNRHDAFQVRCPGCTDMNPWEPAFYHGIGYGPDGLFASIPPGGGDLGGPVVHVDGTGRKFEFMGSSNPDLGDPTMWAPLPADPAGTPPPSLGYINPGLEAMIVDNKMQLPCCKINYPEARKDGGSGDGSKKGMKNAAASDQIRVYPNPATDMLYVEFPASEKVTIRISDVQGRVVATQSLDNTTHARFDVRTFAPGLYMYHIVTDDQVHSGKVLIKK
jgi:PKD repeat protein